MLFQASTNADLTQCIVYIELGDIIGNLLMKLFGCISSTDQFGFGSLFVSSLRVCECVAVVDCLWGTGAGCVWVGCLIPMA